VTTVFEDAQVREHPGFGNDTPGEGYQLAVTARAEFFPATVQLRKQCRIPELAITRSERERERQVQVASGRLGCAGQAVAFSPTGKGRYCSWFRILAALVMLNSARLNQDQPRKPLF